MPVHLEVQDEIVMNREEADLHWELILKKCISIHSSYQGREEGGGEGNSTKSYMGRLCSEVQPLTLSYTVFELKGTPFVYLLLTNGAPNHIPSLELCVPFNRS